MIHIRPAKTDDAESILAIYAPIVETTAISFELVPPTVNEMAERIRAYMASHAYLVAEKDDAVLGYAYGTAYRPRAAYATTCEVTVYVGEKARGQGIGKRLYEKLLPELAKQGYRTAIAGIALPNDASTALHESVGFENAGVLREVGHKFDRWHDLGLWTLSLKDFA